MAEIEEFTYEHYTINYSRTVESRDLSADAEKRLGSLEHASYPQSSPDSAWIANSNSFPQFNSFTRVTSQSSTGEFPVKGMRKSLQLQLLTPQSSRTFSSSTCCLFSIFHRHHTPSITSPDFFFSYSHSQTSSIHSANLEVLSINAEFLPILR